MVLVAEGTCSSNFRIGRTSESNKQQEHRISYYYHMYGFMKDKDLKFRDCHDHENGSAI